MVKKPKRVVYAVIAWPARVEMDRAQAFWNPAPRHREHLTFATPWPKQRFEGFVVLSTTPPKQVQDMFIRGVHMLGDSGEPGAIMNATRVVVSTGNTFAVLPFNPLSICATKREIEQRMELPEMWGAREEPETGDEVATITSRTERLYGGGTYGMTIVDPSPPMRRPNIDSTPKKTAPPGPAPVEVVQEPEPAWLEEDLVPPITSQEYMEKFNKKR